MMQDQVRSVQDDIAYMRALAHEGRHTPQVGGAILVAAGLVFGLAAAIHFLIDYGILRLPPVAYLVVWGSAMVVFIASLVVQIRAVDRKPGALSPVNQATGSAWMGVGLASFVMSLSIGIVAYQVQTPVLALVFPSLIFALYGTGWAVSATMSRQAWQWRLAIGAWIAAPLIAIMISTPFVWLAYAAGILVFALVPGIILMRQEPAEVI